MRWLQAIIVYLLTILPLYADCPESVDYTFHNLTHSGFGQQTPTMYYQLQVNVTGQPAEYLAIGYISGSFVNNGTVEIFNKIPKVHFDNDPHLRGFYRGYVSGDLETELMAVYGQPGTNGTIDLTAFTGDDFLACEDPPPEPGVAITMEEIEPWLILYAMLLGVIAYATSFRVGQTIWDLILRAKNNPTFWLIFFLLCYPSISHAQFGICEKRNLYTDHTIEFLDFTTSKTIRLTVNFSDSTNSISNYSVNQFFQVSGNINFLGIPHDRYLSDSTLRGLWNAVVDPALGTAMQNWQSSGVPPDLTVYAPRALEACSCTEDPSRPDCPNYTPSGPDVPEYCSDGETEDTAPDDPNCGCPGQDYTVCDAECEDADNDLCCDELDPDPTNPACGCTRDGPTGTCDQRCPECEKTIDEYMDQISLLLLDHGLDLSPFLGRGATTGLFSSVTLPSFGPVNLNVVLEVHSDERTFADGPVKSALLLFRTVIRAVMLFFLMIYFVKNFLWVVLR